MIFSPSIQNIRNSRQNFHNSPSVRAQITLNAEDVCLVYKRERGLPSNSINLSGKSVLKTDTRKPVHSVEH